ncbi:bifunctional protein-serine/threonine kinase/phosphatase [Neptunomonas qingdaonensis]|uniref:Protein phosphatase n=1 Tax=Neptunomonas qingdaonensis TaxID=1045558 RepID=A0A1I2UUE1_9GAMM|nr:bifunctional protein-serine/threonine kinase/phosphatase [Neptunomonas qingdaonensis]SFG78381.1 protein phosphatase [Neptunomonas qingdaonensis]
MHLNSEIRLSTAQQSITGRKARNEDCLGFFMPVGNLLTTKGACGMIADGVSTAEAGAEAAEYCVREFINDYFDTPDIWTVKKSAQKVLTAINRSLYSRSHEYLSSTRGYVCTFSVLVIKSHTAHIFHIGDSRIYRIRADHMECLTTDHITPLSQSSSCLSRAMGMDTHLDIDYRTISIEPGDIFFLSTDGVHDTLPPNEIQLVIYESSSLDAACEKLVNLAYDKGSTDNLSCQLIRVDEIIRESIDDLTDKLTELPFPPDLEAGMSIDGYQVISELYASSRSQLYIVKDPLDGKERVMKTPSQNFNDDPAYIERFIMEEWVGSRIDSPHVVKVCNANRPKTFLYYVMDKVEGVSLERWIEETPYPKPSEAIKLVKQIARGLQAFHQRETLHQDLKPSNIMISPDNHITLVDFGSVFVSGINEIFVPIERDRVLGTVNYSDPLLRLGQNTGIKGDLFSLACITYEIFTHHLPYGEGLERCETPQQLEKLKYIPSDRYNPVLPLWFDRALMKGLSIKPEERYDSIDQFLLDATQPNPDFLLPKEVEKKTQSVIFWQMMSLVWFITSMFLVAALWLQD